MQKKGVTAGVGVGKSKIIVKVEQMLIGIAENGFKREGFAI